MALFGRKKRRDGKQAQEQAPSKQHDEFVRKPAHEELQAGPSRRRRSKSPQDEVEANMTMLAQLVQDLATCVDTSGDRPARALRILFALSEHRETDNRIRMVREAGGMLVPELLDFLKRCERGSSEEYLALLVLNNVSIPSQNKRLVSLDCGGAQVLSRLLCLDPSCHVIAIILVNLTFSDAELRRELATKPNVELIESLSFALRVASFSQEEYDTRQPLSVPNGNDVYTPSYLLSSVLDEDVRIRQAVNELDFNDRSHELPLDPACMLYPETAKWCLSALKNLSRPTTNESASATVLVKSRIVHLIVRFIAIGGPLDSDGSVPTADLEIVPNAPTAWESNSMQDAALFLVMNLAAMKAYRDCIVELNGIGILTRITEYNKRIRRDTDGEVTDEQKQLEFQRLKARMALAYLVGSEGHFGMAKRRPLTSDYADFDDSIIIVTETEVVALLELLANALEQRAKMGPGGYSAATFHIKWVLFAIRCLVTHTLNQIQFTNVAGLRLNVLLLKALALHSLKNASSIDAAAAEHASFTLYLLSNRGFNTPFLPGSYGIDDRIAGTGSLTAKVLTSYIHHHSITLAGKHAADQLLLRLHYLCFRGSVTEIASPSGDGPSHSDYAFDQSLLEAADAIVVEKRKHGARPHDDIFDRPILRSRAPKRGTHQAPWENGAAVTVYPNALTAVQELSFGSTKVRHLDAIDDVLIANNIANSANGEKTESYNYWWSWQDSSGDMVKRFLRQRSTDSAALFSSFPSMTKEDTFGEDFPFSFFGCGNLCGADTSVEGDKMQS